MAETDRRGHALPYSARCRDAASADASRRRRRRRRRRRAVRRADRRPRGRARRARLRDAAGARPPATGRRAASPPRSPPTTRPRCTSRTRRAPGAGSSGAARREVLVDEAPDARRASSSALGVRFDADRHGSLALGLEGGHSLRRVVHAGGSATGRRDRAPALGRSSPSTSASPCWRARRAAALLDAPTAAASACVCEDGRAVRARARRSSRPAAPPRCGRARPTRRARSASGLMLAHARRRRARRPRVHAVPPHRGRPACRGREGFLVTEAIRGEGATLHDAGRRALRRRAGAARRGRARDRRASCARRARRHVGLDMRDVDPRCSPTSSTALRDAGVDPATRARPGRPRRALHDGRRSSTDLDGARDASPASTPSASRACTGLHGANRLASNSLSECFVFGAPRRARGARRAARRRCRRAAPPARCPSPAARAARRARRCGATPGLERDARGAARGCSTTRIRSRGSSPRARCCARRAAARHAAPDFPEPTRRSTATTRSCARGAAAFERWTDARDAQANVST